MKIFLLMLILGSLAGKGHLRFIKIGDVYSFIILALLIVVKLFKPCTLETICSVANNSW